MEAQLGRQDFGYLVWQNYRQVCIYVLSHGLQGHGVYRHYNRSHAQFTLDDAQKALDDELTSDIVSDKELQDALVQDLRTLHGIANELHGSRSKDGIMTQMRDELEFGFDDKNDPSSIATKAKKPALKILKEFLLLANQCVAQKISSQFPEQALLRRHAPPNERRIVSHIHRQTYSLCLPIFIFL